jgi:hypothetical protein
MSTSFIPRSHRRLEIIKRDKPSLYPLFERVYSGKAAFLECIEAQCLDCIGLDKDAIRNCGDRCCPLWHVRPYRNNEPSKETQ